MDSLMRLNTITEIQYIVLPLFFLLDDLDTLNIISSSGWSVTIFSFCCQGNCYIYVLRKTISQK